MYLLKCLIVALFLIGGVLSCATRTPTNFSIQEAKSYEASLFRQNCAICHGPEGDGKTLMDGRVVPGLRKAPFKYASDSEIFDHIANGGNGMVPFRGMLTDREIRMMVDFVQRDLRGNNR